MCRELVPSRDPLCQSCIARIPPIATIDMSVTSRRNIPVAAATAYDGVIAHHIMAKHGADPVASEELGWLVAKRCHGILRYSDAVVAVPLHWRRYAQRGFDQSHIMAQRIAREYGVPCIAALQRHAWHGSQANKSHHERWNNVQNVFSVTRAAQHLVGMHVVVIDDVMTSGATMRSAVRTLERAGVVVTGCAVAARVV